MGKKREDQSYMWVDKTFKNIVMDIQAEIMTTEKRKVSEPEVTKLITVNPDLLIRKILKEKERENQLRLKMDRRRLI